jgi:L-alanine-DL-glutamate epimerase-like enolase superfamily enzyme
MLRCNLFKNLSFYCLLIIADLQLTPILLEQPVARDDWFGLQHVTREAHDRFGVLVAADESCRSVDDAARIVKDELANVVNIKIGKLGVMAALEV